MGPLNHNITHRPVAIDNFTDERSIIALKFLFSCSICMYSIEMTVFGIRWFCGCCCCCCRCYFKKKKRQPEFSWEFPTKQTDRNRKYIPNSEQKPNRSSIRLTLSVGVRSRKIVIFEWIQWSTNSEPLIIRLWHIFRSPIDFELEGRSQKK